MNHFLLSLEAACLNFMELVKFGSFFSGNVYSNDTCCRSSNHCRIYILMRVHACVCMYNIKHVWKVGCDECITYYSYTHKLL